MTVPTLRPSPLLCLLLGVALASCSDDNTASDTELDTELDVSNGDVAVDGTAGRDTAADTGTNDVDEVPDDIVIDAVADVPDVVGQDGVADGGDTSDADAGVDAALPAPLTVETTFGEGAWVVLGAGPDGQTQVTDENGSVLFASPGTGPYTITLIDADNNHLYTVADAAGPTVEIDAWETRIEQSWQQPSAVEPGTLTIQGAVSGRTCGDDCGDNLRAFLLVDGVQVAESRVEDPSSWTCESSDPECPEKSYQFSNVRLWDEEQIARVFVAEFGTDDRGAFVGMGARVIDPSSSFPRCDESCESINELCEDGGTGSSGGFCDPGTDCADCGAREVADAFYHVDVALDVVPDRTVNVTATDWTFAPGARPLSYALIIDGHRFWPTREPLFSRRCAEGPGDETQDCNNQLPVRLSSGRNTVSGLPRFEGSLAGFSGELTVYTGDDELVSGTRELIGVYPDRGDLPVTVAFEPLVTPGLAVEDGRVCVGRGLGVVDCRPVLQDVDDDQLNLAFSPATGADSNLLWFHKPEGCWTGAWSWTAKTAGDTTSFTTFELPAEFADYNIPLGETVEVRLFSLATNAAGGEFESFVATSYRLAGGDRCAATPTWLAGNWVSTYEWFSGGSTPAVIPTEYEKSDSCNATADRTMEFGPCGLLRQRSGLSDEICARIASVDDSTDAAVLGSPNGSSDGESFVEDWSLASVFSGAESVAVRALDNTFRGFDAISGVGLTSDAYGIWVRPDVGEPASDLPATLAGTYNAISLSVDTLADDDGSPGLNLGSEFSGAFTSPTLVINDDGTFEVSSGPSGTDARGVISAFSGAQGVLRFATNSASAYVGICGDYQAQAALVWVGPIFDTIVLITNEYQQDTEDADRDLDTEDFVFFRSSITFVR
jgi:hypothetical protein